MAQEYNLWTRLSSLTHGPFFGSRAVASQISSKLGGRSLQQDSDWTILGVDVLDSCQMAWTSAGRLSKSWKVDVAITVMRSGSKPCTVSSFEMIFAAGDPAS